MSPYRFGGCGTLPILSTEDPVADYLGSVEYTFTLNFSKPAAPVIAQMFNFLNLGFDGYRKIAWKDLRNARMLSKALESTYFTVSYLLRLSPAYRR